MANTTLLSLPTELLDRVYFYLDWDRSESLFPHHPDVINTSLTCRRLREASLPSVFRHVTLKLRWFEGALIEPALFRLRRDYPHLAKHVRSVYIQTCFGQQKGQLVNSNIFAIPDDFSSWLSFAVNSEEAALDREVSHQKRLSHVARGFIEKYFYTEMPSNCPAALRSYIKNLVWKFLDSTDYDKLADSAKKWFMATQEAAEAPKRLAENWATGQMEEATTAQLRKYRDVRLQLDAFVVSLLCLPASMNSFSFEALPTSRWDILQNDFASHVAANTLNIFGDRLHRLTMITNPEKKFAQAPNAPDDPVLRSENTIFNDTVVRTLKQMNVLVLSNSDTPGRPMSRELLSDWQVHWHLLASTITQLELWNLAGNDPELIAFITGFTGLQRLTLNNAMLRSDRRHPPARIHGTNTCWLTLLIELRRQMPDLNLRLRELHTPSHNTLSHSAIQWLLKEAVPVGQAVGFDRETRLTEDFASFLPLWTAEDSDRGEQAKEDRKNGKLVDEAMASRWRNFY